VNHFIRFERVLRACSTLFVVTLRAASCALLLASLAAPRSFADEGEHDAADAPPLSIENSVTLTQLNVRHAFFGAPIFEENDANDLDYSWGEFVLRSEARWRFRSHAALVVGGLGLGTVNTDYYERHNEFAAVIEPLYLHLGQLAEQGDGVSLKIGRHDRVLGEGFLVGDGENDADAALWSIPEQWWDGISAEARRSGLTVVALAADLSPSFGIVGVDPADTTQTLELDARGRVYAADLAYSWNERTRAGVTGFARDDDGLTDEDLRIVSGRATVPLGSFNLGGELARQGGRVQAPIPGRGAGTRTSPAHSAARTSRT